MGWTPTAWGGIDGDFQHATQAGEFRVSRHMEEDPSAMVVTAEFWQLRSEWAPLANNQPGPVIAGLQTYAVHETELIDLGGGIVKWDRVYANIPFPRVEESTISKTIKYLFTIWDMNQTPPTFITASVVSATKTVRCHVHYDYGFNPAPLPDVPDVVIYNLGGGNSAWCIGGWPVPTAQNWNSNNEGTSFIQGEIGTYMGGIRYRKRVYGPA